MAQIPLGNFRVASALPVAEPGRVVTPDPATLNRGAQHLAGSVSQIADNYQQQKNREDMALAKVKASNALIDREAQIRTITADLDEQLRAGKLDHSKIEEAYHSSVNKLEPLDTPGLDEVTMAEVGNSVKRLNNSGLDGIRAAAAGARIESAKADLVGRMDMLGKDAAAPGADIDAINKRMDAEDIDVAGHLAFGADWVNKKQAFRDQNWSTHATQRVIESGNDVASLQKVEKDLTSEDGLYAKKLDPDKRNQLLNTVTGRIFQVQEHNARQAEIAELKGARILDQMDKQAATGIPPTPEDQARWQSGLAGTSMAGEFNSRIQGMNEIQSLLRAPLADQQAYIDKKRQQMAVNGGSVTDQANVARLQTAVDANTKLLKEQPLQFNAHRTGADVPPLDLSGIATPEGQQQLAEQIAHRFDVVGAVRKQYGPEVARNPWKPEEAALLKSVLAQADDGLKLQVLGALAKSAPTAKDYSDALAPLAADQPTTQLAGLAQFNGLKGADGTDVAQTMLAGEKILKDKSTPMPSEGELRLAFDEAVGTSIASGTPQREKAYLAFKSIYAGVASSKGVSHEGTNPLTDDETVEQAIQLSTGGIGERAGAKVVKPYGMSDDDFDSAVDVQLSGMAERTKFPLGELEDMPLSPVPGKQGVYFLMNAGRPQIDPTTQQPMTVTIK